MMKLLSFLVISLCLCLPSVLSYCGLSGCEEESENRGLYGFFYGLHRKFGSPADVEGLRGNMTFHLYNNKNNLSDSEVVQIASTGLFSKFNPDLPTKLIIHGWKNSIKSAVEQFIKNAYLENYNVNVICVDWSGAANKVYHKAKLHTIHVASIVSEFIDRMSQEKGLETKNLHIIGHSLGAHISGMSARSVKSGRVSRITGLDPADPLFRMDSLQERLANDAADFVEVLHTGGKRLGARPPLGHVDLYPNGGDAVQRGCGNDVSGACSHSRAVDMYCEALSNPNAFIGYLCEDWKTFRTGACLQNETYHMGENVNRSIKGNFYFKTANTAPYGLGETGQTFLKSEIKEDNELQAWASRLFNWIM